MVGLLPIGYWKNRLFCLLGKAPTVWVSTVPSGRDRSGKPTGARGASQVRRGLETDSPVTLAHHPQSEVCA